MEKYNKYKYVKNKHINFGVVGDISEIIEIKNQVNTKMIRYNKRSGGSTYYYPKEEKKFFIYVTEKYALKHGYINAKGNKIEGIQ